jgi:regulator of protease activity HflC (stomatin/prohibitin superfamily)
MFGIRFIKVDPTKYLIQYKGGRVVREGAGLSFFFYAPTSTLVVVPVGSTDVPFIFNEVTADFQEVSIQGQVAFRVADAKKTAQLLDFSLDPTGRKYASDDPSRLAQRIINVVKVLTQRDLQALALRDALKAANDIAARVSKGLAASTELASLGIELLGVSILAIKPTPETSRALEAETREKILRESDEAIYARRNSAVEQERAIKENELNTEIAVEVKKRQIKETQMEAEKAVQEKQHELQAAELTAQVEREKKREELVVLATENAKRESDAKAYAVKAVMDSLGTVDPKTLQALASVGMEPNQLIALAFQGLAERADKIGELNISPELLRELIGRRE